MERSWIRRCEELSLGLLMTALCVLPSTGLAQTFGYSGTTLTYMNQPFTPHSAIGTSGSISFALETDPTSPYDARAMDGGASSDGSLGEEGPIREVTVDYEASLGEAGETTPSVWTTGSVAGNSVSIQSDTRLVIDGLDTEDPLVVDATPKRFSSWNELFAYAESQLGATLIRDDTGGVVAAFGRYTRRGSVVFDDDGDLFESLDYVAAHLGGRSGAFEVDGQTIALGADAAPPDDVVFYLGQTEPDCDPNGDNCIEGHTWLTHAVVYHSAGARTKQISGGTRTVWGTRCEPGTGSPVSHEGVPMCRRIDPNAWQYNHATGELELADDWDGSDPYIYTPRVATTYEALANELSVRAKAILGPFSAVDVAPVIGNNVWEVELGEWAILKDGLDTPLGEPIPIRSIIGLCGYHSSRVYPTPADSGSSASAMTADGSTGDDDLHCTGGDPLSLSLESTSVLANGASAGF